MAFRADPPEIKLVDIIWDQIGEDEPTTRLLAHIRIAGVDMHLEAREVTIDREGFQTTLEYPDDHGALCNMSDTAGFTTAEIDGREYFIYALPYGL